ncbi:MAG: CHAD domain-containing protein [Rhizobiales bacterium]|nr:CHAD domain-containing protein [Hyphomicrobiales bacterium]
MNGSRKVARQRASATPISALSCQTAFQSIAQDCIASIRKNHMSARKGSAEAIHQIRVALTRFRAARAFFSRMVKDAVWPRLKQEMAWLNDELGVARDDDVLLNYGQRKLFRDWLGTKQRKLAARVRARHRRLEHALRSARYKRLLDLLATWSESGPWTRHGNAARLQKFSTYSQARLHSWRKRLVKKGGRISHSSATQRHHLRIKAKRYRYMLEAVATLGIANNFNKRKLAKRVQQALGDLRDLQCFRQSCGKRRKPPPGYPARKKQLLRKADKALRLLKYRSGQPGKSRDKT